MKELKHEPDLLAAQPGQRIFVEPRDVHAVDEHLTRSRRVEAGDQTEQRRLPAARRSNDREELSAGDLKRERMQDRERFSAARHRFRDFSQLNHVWMGPRRWA